MAQEYKVKAGRIAWVVTAALATMRKPEEWVIYPKHADSNEVQIQCGTRIARFDLDTGKGVISKRCANGAYGYHLLRSLGASEFIAPQELCDAIKAEPRIVGNSLIIHSTNPDPDYITQAP